MVPVREIEAGESEAEELVGLVKETRVKGASTAIEIDAYSEKMPENYLIRRREEGALCGVCGGKIENIKIAGSSAYFCPKHQK